MKDYSRRDAFRMGLASTMIPSSRGQSAGAKKKVIVIGAGIGLILGPMLGTGAMLGLIFGAGVGLSAGAGLAHGSNQ